MNRIYSELYIDIILDNISNGVQVINENGELIYSNRSVAIQDDINISESLGKHLLEVYPSLDEETSTLLKVIKTGQTIYDFEQHYTNYRGNKIHTLNTTIPVLNDAKIVGAIEISKDVTDVKKLSEKVYNLRKKSESEKSEVVSDDAVYTFEDILSKDSSMQRLKSKAMRAARGDVNVLVSGETGTGKELLVQSIHNGGKRVNAPFIVQNCAALPATLLEGILFGTKKGGFTDAIDRPGLFEIATGGTLFLDEINSMPMELQAKLLRVIQEGKIRRVGDLKSRKVDVKVIAATNIEPLKAVEDGFLRRDLYYRFAMFLEIPPLRDRKNDILLLTKYFINKFNNELYLQVKGLSKKVEELFLNYKWPGNVRELEHVIKGAMHILEGKSIRVIDLPTNLMQYKVNDSIVLNNADTKLKGALEKVERQLIINAIELSGENITKAAKTLGIPRQTLQYKIKKLEI